jgi:uncharacterized 2Fe-2S/4Fe-4S cluster protein (DUF4445 family)
MSDSEQPKDAVSLTVERLLSGPARPGQAFTMPGCNYDGLYRLARRFKFVFDGNKNDTTPVCLCSDDRTVMAAACLAALAGGSKLVLPPSLSTTSIYDLHQLTRFGTAIGKAGQDAPAGVTVIDPETLTDEAETLTACGNPEPDRPWIQLFSVSAAGVPRLWSKTPRNLLGEVDEVIARFGIDSGARILATIPASSLYGLVYSLLTPLVASARVVAQSPSSSETIKQHMADASPTIFVGMPVHYRSLNQNPPDRGALTLAFTAADPLAEADGLAFSKLTGVNLVEVYGSTETGGIATRCRAAKEAAFTAYSSVKWRLAADRLDVRSPLFSAELPVRSSGWYTMADRVKAHGSDGFVVTRRTDTIGSGDEHPLARQKDHQQITFEPAGLKVPLDEAKTLQELGTAHRIDIRADCGGIGVCGKCRVVVHPKAHFSAPTDAELDVLTPDQIINGYRLACQARAANRGSVTLTDSRADGSEARGKTEISGSYPVDPMTRRLPVAGRSSELKTDRSPQSLVEWLADQVGHPEVARADIVSLRRLARYRDSLKAFTLVVNEETGIRRILEGSQTTSLGFAVDLGTTSLAGYLCDLKTGRLLAAEACVNPQRRFGEDVISRISRINEKDERLPQFQGLAVEGINFLMTSCLERVGASSEAVDEVAVCGNTTMQQVFSGIHPCGLGVFPYLPLTRTPPLISAGDIGLRVDPLVPVFIMPVVSGFIGGDTVAAMLAERPHKRDEITLLVDIGTNGEVVLGNRERLWTTSCATGPALEGAQISCGMRAVSGAIHRAWPDETLGRVAFDVLGNEGKNRPMGICGSGIIDAIAALRQIGVILPNGRLVEGNVGVATDENGVGQTYTIAGTDQTATGADIVVTLKDVRQIQLAKSALATGIDFLMRKAGIQKIDRTVLTGAFGARFNWKNALAIGMLPPAVANGKVVAKDNLAGVGVVMALLDKKLRSEARDLCDRIRYLELASEPDFAMAFARATAFPPIPI